MFDFPSSPTLGQVYQGYIWDGEKWTMGAVPAATSSPKKNYVINGAMQISQELGFSAIGPSSGSGIAYIADQFAVLLGSLTGTVTQQNMASATPGGSPNRLRITVGTAEAGTIAASHYVLIQQKIEGLRCADLRWGSASPKSVTLRFGVKAPAGTYSVVFRNGTPNRSYAAEYTIAAGEANTDAVKTVTIPGDATGTWAVDNTTGIDVIWGLACGSTNQIAPGAWVAASGLASTNQFNFMGTSGNIFELFDVGLYEGSAAPSFVVPDYASELALCQRYYYSATPASHGFACPSTGGYAYNQRYDFKVTMRIAPTVTTSYSSQTAVSAINASTRTPDFFTDQIVGTALANVLWVCGYKANARM